MNNIRYLLIAVFVAQLYKVRGGCTAMEERLKFSKIPITALKFFPDDDMFAVGCPFTIACTGSTPDNVESSAKYAIPKEINIYVLNQSKFMEKHTCSFASNDTRAVKTCVHEVKFTKTGRLRVNCGVDNWWGCSYQSKNFVIKKKEPPYFIEQPPRFINVTEGQDLNITCISRVVPIPLITWYRNGVAVKKHIIKWNKKKSVLMMKSINSSSQGEYTCRANNSLGESLSNASYITVFSRPRIGLSPASQTVNEGSKVSMFCNVTGLPVPVIGWLKDGALLQTGSGSGNETHVNSSLTGSKSSVAEVPDIRIHPSLTSVILNMTTPSNIITPTKLMQSRSTDLLHDTTHVVIVTSPTPRPAVSTNTTRPSPSSISTVKERFPPTTSVINEQLLTTRRRFLDKITQKGRQSTLVIQSVSRHDQGKYQCYASNAIGSVKSLQALLLVHDIEKPWFVVSPRNVSVSVGSSATMNCTAVGYPMPNITWYKDKSPVIGGERVFVVTNGNASVLTATSAERQDEGKYSCKAENSFGTNISEQAFLDITDVPPNAAPNTRRGSINAMIPILGTLLPVLVITTVIVIIIIRKKRRQEPQNTTLKLSTSNIPQAQRDEGIENEVFKQEEYLDDLVYLLLMGIERDWEVSRDRLRLTNQTLGVGCFGQVHKGLYTRKDGKEMFVAVKTLKDPTKEANRDDILAELEMLKRVGRHPNIVSLVGACTREEPPCVIIEFVEGGSLNDLLLKTRLPPNREKGYENIRSRLTDRELVQIAVDVANGMNHLHGRNCIHRDLAARNILIGKGLVAKIADFGLARHVADGIYFKHSAGKVPWKWMSPEALQGLFTTKSDVWSFGILLWEIATLGNCPYPMISELVSLYNLLSSGYRMERPPQCDELLYSVMMECWSAEADKRPGFENLYRMLEDILNQNKRIYINIEEMFLEELEHKL